MADVSILEIGGNSYNIKDATAREAIAALESGVYFLGVTSTELADGDTTNPITIDGSSVTAKNGDIVIYGTTEFILDGTKWNAFGDVAYLGDLAYKDNASGTFTPAGSVTVNETTGNINTITSVGTLPSSSYDSATETLSFNSGTLPTMSSTTVMTGATASFTGTSGNVTVS